MILLETSSSPSVRSGEMEIAGRRAAVRALPYVGEAGEPRYRFDPADRCLHVRRRDARVLVGPHRSETWRAALRRSPGGPALVGPCLPVEEIYGAFLAAAEGARASGRPVYLLDPDPAGLPSEPGSAFVALFVWSPDAETRLFRALAGTRRIPSGLLLPVVPGWTDEDRFLDSLLSRVRDLGAGFAAPFRLCGDGETRRALVEARGEVAPEEMDRFFERVHHGDAQSERESQRRIRAAVERLGLEAIPTRPVGLGEARGNAGAAARLEEKAQASDENEHRAALLRAAARWIDESGRDLGAVLREGNFAKVFPFGEQVRREAEAAFVSPERAEAPR